MSDAAGSLLDRVSAAPRQGARARRGSAALSGTLCQSAAPGCRAGKAVPGRAGPEEQAAGARTAARADHASDVGSGSGAFVLGGVHFFRLFKFLRRSCGGL